MTMIIDGINGGFFPSWTTGTRPASPAVGQMGYNTTTGLFDQYTASGWSSVGAAPGNVIQVVSAVVNTSFSTSSTTLQATGNSLSITPKFATSKIFIIASLYLFAGQNGAGQPYVYMRASLARGSTQLVEGRHNVNSGTTSMTDAGGNYSITYLDSPATTSSTTYNIYISALQTAFLAQINNNAPSTITLMEIAA